MGFTPVKGRTTRVTSLNDLGDPIYGPDSVITTNGIVTVEFTAEQLEIEAVQVQNYEGLYCVDLPAETRANGYGINITFCEVEPELYAMLSGQPVVYDADDNPIGFDVEYDRKTSRFAMENWTGLAVINETARAGYMVNPFVQGGAIGDFTLENGAVTFQITGARTLKGARWGSGPYNVQEDADGLPIPLTPPLNPKTALRVISTTLAPPEPQSGAHALGVPATGITAGSPATTTPAESFAPANLAELVLADPVADPTTAWTPTQYVVLRDGSRATWNGTDWVAFG